MTTVRPLLLGVMFGAGCASGGNPTIDPDAATVDGTIRQDASETFVDARMVDARPDAPPPPDAAPVIADAAPLPPDACVPASFEKLVNPVFDLTPTGVGWTQQPIQNIAGGPYPVITADGLTAHSAPNKAWLGGFAGEDATPAAASVTDQLFQDVVIPATTNQIVITGSYVVGTTEAAGTTVYDTFRLDVVQTNGTPIETVLSLNNTMPVGTFTAFTRTLTANVAGQTIRLRATSTNDVTKHTNFFLDTLSLKARHCP